MKRRYVAPAGMCPSSSTSFPSWLPSPMGLGSIVLMVIPSSQPGVEQEHRLLQILTRIDREPCLVVQAATNPSRRIQLDGRRPPSRLGGFRPLPEDIQQSRHREKRNEHHDRATDRHLTFAGLVAVVLERQKVRRARHSAAFAARRCFPTSLDWCGFGAPVAQGIERCPAEAEVASSNLAGRICQPCGS